MDTRAVATSSSQPTKYINLSSQEETERQIESDVNLLKDLRQRRRKEFINEALKRITSQVPEWNSLEQVKLLASIWNMLGTPNTAQVLARDIYSYVSNIALPRLKSLTLTELQALDPTVADPFSDGTPWPT